MIRCWKVGDRVQFWYADLQCSVGWHVAGRWWAIDWQGWVGWHVAVFGRCRGAGCNRDGRCGAISQKSAFQGFIFCWVVPPVIKVCEYTCKTEMSGFFFVIVSISDFIVFNMHKFSNIFMNFFYLKFVKTMSSFSISWFLKGNTSSFSSVVLLIFLRGET